MSENNNLTLHTDFYEINMMATYFEKHMENRHAVFEAFFRKLPFGNGYAVFAGLEHIIQYIENLHFTDSDIDYLKEVTDYPDSFLNYLRNFKFKGTVRSAYEGDVVFANEPILQVEGTLCECQLVETAILNMINYQTLIATKASRIRTVVGDDPLMEFGSRRAQEVSAAIWGTRAAIIGGFNATSNVLAGKNLGFRLAELTPIHSLNRLAMITGRFMPMPKPITTVSSLWILMIRSKVAFPVQSKLLMKWATKLILRAFGWTRVIWLTCQNEFEKFLTMLGIPIRRFTPPTISMKRRLPA